MSEEDCVCECGLCLGIPGETTGCDYCLSLNVEARCPKDN